MELPIETKDILQELINTGIGRAASAFSELLNQEIDLKVPSLFVLTLSELKQYFQSVPEQEYINVTQSFSGGLQGKGVVSFPMSGGKTLINTLLANPTSQPVDFDLSEREVMAEVGNLIINSVGCSISDMAGVEIHCQLPTVAFDNQMIPLEDEATNNIYCVGEGAFTVQGIDVEGTIIFIYSYENIEMLIKELHPGSTNKILKILIVDDSLLIRQSIKRQLKDLGEQDYALMEAKTAEECLTVLANHTPDLLIMDLLMPGIGGEGLLQQIKEKNISCFITVLSSNFQKPVRERVLGGGAKLFIEKPITKEKLVTILEQYHQHSKNHV